jgi:hypothetical protein
VVDDNPFFLQSLGRHIARWGGTLTGFSSPALALDWLKNPLKKRPDMFLIDWTLPGYFEWDFVVAVEAALLERHSKHNLGSGGPGPMIKIVAQCPLLLFTPPTGFDRGKSAPTLRYLAPCVPLLSHHCAA